MLLNMTKSDFLNDYQTKKPFLQKNAFNPDLEWETVDEIISRCDISSQDFKLNYQGKVLDKNDYIEEYEDIGKTRYRFIRDRLYFYMQNGATLIANKIANEPIIYKYRREIEHLSGRPTLASLYLAYGEDSSFKAHWDTRDVFVYQFEGKKRWTIYQPNFELPINHQQSKDLPNYTCPTTPYMDIILEKGDILYVPRGWWHDPIPVGDVSLHLSIGTYPIYPTDFMHWICKLLPDYDIESRKDLFSFKKSKDHINIISNQFQKLINNEDTFNFFQSQIQEKVYRTETPLNLNLLGNPYNKGNLPKNFVIDINIINNIDYSFDFLVINGIKFNVSDESKDVVKFLIENYRVEYLDLIKKFKNIDLNKLNKLIYDLSISDILSIHGC